MKLIYCSYKDSHFIIDIDSLEIIDSDNFNKYFTTLKIGINSIRIQNNINLNSFLFNKEVNGMLLTVKKNSISQENCSGILLSDPIEECTITSLI